MTSVMLYARQRVLRGPWAGAAAAGGAAELGPRSELGPRMRGLPGAGGEGVRSGAVADAVTVLALALTVLFGGIPELHGNDMVPFTVVKH